MRWLRMLHVADFVRVEGVLQSGVERLGLRELIFQDHDPARALQGVACVDQLAHPRGDPQLIARVATMPPFRALRGQQARTIKGAQKRLGDTKELGGATHAVGGEILVI